jgi:hypothetical protein
MKRLALLLALVGCIGMAVPASAHNLTRKPKVGVTGDIFKFRGTKWQPNAPVFWEYYARPRDNSAIQTNSLTTGPRGKFRLLFRDFNLGKHKMCFTQVDTRFPRAAGQGRIFRKCKKYEVFGTDFLGTGF